MTSSPMCVRGWRRQGWLLLTALAFMTRIPVPMATPVDRVSLSACSRWFPLVGLLIGLASALIYQLALTLWTQSVAVVMAMAAAALLTGGLHEDGLADTLDGIGGGCTVERRLAIMKDSRVGSYGVLGLGLVLLGRFALLNSTGYTVILLILSHCLSRALATGLMSTMPYRRQNPQDHSRIESLTGGQSRTDQYIILATVLIAIKIWLPLPVAFTTLTALVLFGYILRVWLMRRLGGYTGDTLGAAQQLGELLVLAVLTAWFGHG